MNLLGTERYIFYIYIRYFRFNYKFNFNYHNYIYKKKLEKFIDLY